MKRLCLKINLDLFKECPALSSLSLWMLWHMRSSLPCYLLDAYIPGTMSDSFPFLSFGFCFLHVKFTSQMYGYCTFQTPLSFSPPARLLWLSHDKFHCPLPGMYSRRTFQDSSYFLFPLSLSTFSFIHEGSLPWNVLGGTFISTPLLYHFSLRSLPLTSSPCMYPVGTFLSWNLYSRTQASDPLLLLLL